MYIINKTKRVEVKKIADPGDTLKLSVIETETALYKNTCTNWNNPKQANITPIPNCFLKWNSKSITKATKVACENNKAIWL